MDLANITVEKVWITDPFFHRSVDHAYDSDRWGTRDGRPESRPKPNTTEAVDKLWTTRRYGRAACANRLVLANDVHGQ